MSKTIIVAHILNGILLSVLVLATLGFISFANPYGFFLALVSASIAFGVYKHNRWAYFSAAAWALACYQLAKQGYEFQSIKRYVMVLGFLLVPIAIFLHETLAKKSRQNVQDANTDVDNKKNTL